MFEFFDDESDSATPNRQTAPGQVRFDARGNAIYAWKDAQLELDDQRAAKLRERALLNPNLALVDDTPAPDQAVVHNDKGLRVGYNPYESGQLAGKPPIAKKRDMRELSKWIEMKRRLDAQNPPASSKGGMTKKNSLAR